jgi:glycosyltransferase involved in cell wall biosynthesis
MNNLLPLVSIGIPVFNGASDLAHALDSIIGQDYGNLEIILSDNGSTDGTSAICMEYMQRDQRIKYYRSEENHGSSWNFNRVFNLSNGKYFLWAAHDDHRHSSFVRVCVEKLEQCQDAVLCQSYTETYIENSDNMLYRSTLDSFEDKNGLVDRYRETMENFPATALYGVYRSSSIQKTQIFRKSIASDLAFAQELSIYGKFVQVPIVMFTYRARVKWNSIHDDYRVIFNGESKPWWYIPFVVLFFDHWQRLTRANISKSSKLILWIFLLKYEIRQLMLKILTKAVGQFCPKGWKRKAAFAMYRWRFGGRNITIGEENLFFERVITPQLGWNK